MIRCRTSVKVQLTVTSVPCTNNSTIVQGAAPFRNFTPSLVRLWRACFELSGRSLLDYLKCLCPVRGKVHPSVFALALWPPGGGEGVPPTFLPRLAFLWFEKFAPHFPARYPKFAQIAVGPVGPLAYLHSTSLVYF